MEVCDSQRVIALQSEKTLLGWQIRGLDRMRQECRHLDACWEAAEKFWGQLKCECDQIENAVHYEILTPIHSGSEKSIWFGIQSRKKDQKTVDDIKSHYLTSVTWIGEAFINATGVPWQMAALKKRYYKCKQEIEKLKKDLDGPIEVEGGEVTLCLCPDAVVGNQIEVILSREDKTVAIANSPLNALLQKMKFGRKFTFAKCLRVDEIQRVDARKEEVVFSKIETEEQLETLKQDLLKAGGEDKENSLLTR